MGAGGGGGSGRTPKHGYQNGQRHMGMSLSHLYLSSKVVSKVVEETSLGALYCSSTPKFPGVKPNEDEPSEGAGGARGRLTVFRRF